MYASGVLLVVVAAVNCGYGDGTLQHEKINDEGNTTQCIDGPVTITPSGVIRGCWMYTRKGSRFQAYRSIPYAEPPIGELRFQPPKPILRYHREVDASKMGPSCPLPAPNSNYYIDEDCLKINVYTPKNNRKNLLPVVFFIHPGGFYSMTGRSDLAGPLYLMERDLVFVSINYRLASLGFMSTGDKYAPGNNGMKDQVVALKWIQRNIEAFGGDPNRVTIAGVSAGSLSVVLHMISPMTKGLFHRAIAISGSPFSKVPTPTHLNYYAVKQAEVLNCPTNSSKAIVDCLKTKPWRDLGNSYPKFFEIGFDPVRLWSPVVERDFGQERYLTEDPVVVIQEGRMHAVPLIISETTLEFSWFAFNVVRNETLVNGFNVEWDRLAPISFILPRENAGPKVQRLKQVYLGGKPLANDEASLKGMGALYRDSIGGFPIDRLVKLMAEHSPKPVYQYEFAYVGNNSYYKDPITRQPMGAVHHDDMIYLVYHSYRFPSISLNSPDNEIVEKMTAIWYNFARYGDPNPRGDTPELETLSWPVVKINERKYLRIGQEFSVLPVNKDKYKLWEELYPLCPWLVNS